MDNSVNFKGAIILKQPTPRIQRMIKSSLGTHHQILKNFTPEGDVLYIVRRGKDKSVAEFLTHHRTKFEFYIDLSTKSGFDDEKLDEARQILAGYKSKIISTVDELKDFFRLGSKNIALPFSKKHKANPLEASVKALDIDINNVVINQKNGYSDIADKNGKLLARISAPGQYGISFAFKYLEPKNKDFVDPNENLTQRFALRGGEKIFQYTNESGRAQFLKNYNRAVKANRKTTETL